MPPASSFRPLPATTSACPSAFCTFPVSWPAAHSSSSPRWLWHPSFPQFAHPACASQRHSPMSNINSILRNLLLLMLLAFLATCALVLHAAPATTPDAQELLRKSDTYRNGWPSFVTHVKITNYESGKPDEEKLYE